MHELHHFVASQLGGVTNRDAILVAGFTPAQIEAALRLKVIRRVRKSWFAVAGADADVARAVACRGALTGASAARLYRLWVPRSPALHVAVPRNASRLSLAVTKQGESSSNDGPVCLHWRRSAGVVRNAVEPILHVLEHAVDCMAEEMAIVLMDSALNKSVGDLTQYGLQSAFDALPVKYRRAAAKTDPASQSGIETLLRLRLRARRVKLTSQVGTAGVGWVDFVVGDRFVIEVDGRETHDTASGFRNDRERDLKLFDGDYLTLRLTYEHVMYRWHEVEPIILRKIRRREHLWPRHRTLNQDI